MAGRQGRRAYRFELRDGDNPGGYGERCELAQAIRPRTGAGSSGPQAFPRYFVHGMRAGAVK